MTAASQRRHDHASSKIGGFATERDARQALNDASASLRRGTYIEASRQTLGDYLS